MDRWYKTLLESFSLVAHDDAWAAQQQRISTVHAILCVCLPSRLSRGQRLPGSKLTRTAGCGRAA